MNIVTTYLKLTIILASLFAMFSSSTKLEANETEQIALDTLPGVVSMK